jgi:ornithine cyclodeaminase
MQVQILSEDEIRECAKLDNDVISVVEEGFSRLADSNVYLPPIMMIEVPENKGEVDVKSAHIEGYPSFAVKLASGYFETPSSDSPSGSGMMVLISAETGFPQAVLFDNAYLTNVRTGAAGAVAAKYLAPKEVTTAGVIGSGTQARFQIKALQKVRDFERLLVYSRTAENVQKYISEMEPALGVEVIAADGPEEVVRNSEVVVTTTPSRKPFLKSDWLHPGLHITAMGSDTERKQELFPEVLSSADLLVCDNKSQCFRLGELHYGREAGLIAPNGDIIELGEITSGQRSGRSSDQEITVCDLTGVGVQDTVIALFCYQKAKEKKLGLEVDV